MNIFIIPSWYPSIISPIAGIFFKEQARYLADFDKSNKIAISLWGQSDDNLKWFTKDLLPLNTFFYKALYTLAQRKKRYQVTDNLFEYYNPVVTWSDRIKNGNFQGIIKANEENLNAFIKKEGKADLIHAHVSFPAGFIAKYLSEKHHIPYVITEHMGPFPFNHLLNKDGSLQNIVLEPLKYANKIIAVSPSLCNKIKSFNLPEPICIPNIIDEDYFNVSVQMQNNPQFSFFCLSSIIPSKGIKELLFAIQNLSNRSKLSFIVNIGGDGEYLEEYQNLTEKLKLNDKVKWLGKLNREEVRVEFHNCDAFVLPSHLESFGIVYAEALACGKPVIGTYSGGPESIVNEQNGVLVKVGDAEDLAAKMELIMENIKNYKAIEIRKDFEKRFSKRAIVPKVLSLYNDIIKS